MTSDYKREIGGTYRMENYNWMEDLNEVMILIVNGLLLGTLLAKVVMG